MQSEPADGTSDYRHLHHDGTISSDGFLSSDSLSSDGFGDGILGFGSLYPFPTFGPAPDAPAWHATVPAAAAQTATDAGGNASGSGGASLDAQAQGDPAGLVIIANDDSSIVDLPTAQYNEVTGAIAAAISFYEAEFTNPITLTIDFGVSNLGSGVLSDSTPQGADISYDTLRNALEGPVTAAGGNPLPAYDSSGSTSDPFGPYGVWFASDAELTALGFNLGNPVDGDVELNSNLAEFTFNPGDRAVSGEYDAIGALEHEISEVMGRVAHYPTPDDSYSPLDLFRYTSPGTIATSGGAAYFSIDGGQTSLAEFNNNGLPLHGDAGDWSSQPGDIDPVSDDSYDAFSSSGVENAVSQTDLTEMEMLGYTLAAACCAAGTRILTPRGEMPVEELAIGDLVQARFAGLVPVKWIGHRIDCRSHPEPREVCPVRVVAGAIAPGVPQRDLLLSPDHAVAVGNVLVPIRLLANGASIRQEAEWSRVHYFHIELDRHDLLLADGLAAESYLDTGNRGMFANADSPPVPHSPPEEAAAQRQREAMSCLPLCCVPSDVEPLWRALAARAEGLGLALPAVATTDDPLLCIVAGTRRFAPVLRDGHRYTFVLPALPGGARLHSRCAVPSALQPWLEDRRRLGVMVRRLALRCGDTLVEVAPDDPSLTTGWWAPEHDDAVVWRWTDGDAVLPPTEGAAILEVSIGETLAYPLAKPAPDAACAAPHL